MDPICPEVSAGTDPTFGVSGSESEHGLFLGFCPLFKLLALPHSEHTVQEAVHHSFQCEGLWLDGGLLRDSTVHSISLQKIATQYSGCMG